MMGEVKQNNEVVEEDGFIVERDMNGTISFYRDLSKLTEDCKWKRLIVRKESKISKLGKKNND